MATAARASAGVGLIRLAVMGENLALNMADHGYRLALCNRTTAVMAHHLGFLTRLASASWFLWSPSTPIASRQASQGTPASMSATRPPLPPSFFERRDRG